MLTPSGGTPFGDRSHIVDIETVRQGHDVRTTLMLRNLPNQMTCHKLKEILDASNFGECDFSYVRIDYKKGINVGYGFVHFADPAAIVKFLEQYAGRRWMPELPAYAGLRRPILPLRCRDRAQPRPLLSPSAALGCRFCRTLW